LNKTQKTGDTHVNIPAQATTASNHQWLEQRLSA